MLVFYYMEDLEGSKKFAFELLVPLRFDVFAIQPDLFTRSVASALYSLIMGFFLQLLCVKKVLTANFYQLSQLFCQLVSRARSRTEVNILFKRDSEVVAAIEFKWGVTSAGILGIVLGKFRHWQKPCPVILFPIDKGSEIYFYCTVLSLGLAVCFKIEGSR